MLGSIIKYTGEGEGHTYKNFIGHVGYIAHFTPVARSDGKARLTVKWFEPLPVHGWRQTTLSHFALEDFEVLSGPSA